MAMTRLAAGLLFAALAVAPVDADEQVDLELALARFGEDEVCAPGFMGAFAETCRTFAPLARFLMRALDLPW